MIEEGCLLTCRATAVRAAPLVLPATLRPLRSKPICHLRHTLPRTGQLHSLEAHQVSSVQTFNLEESSEQERDQ